MSDEQLEAIEQEWMRVSKAVDGGQ